MHSVNYKDDPRNNSTLGARRWCGDLVTDSTSTTRNPSSKKERPVNYDAYPRSKGTLGVVNQLGDYLNHRIAKRNMFQGAKAHLVNYDDDPRIMGTLGTCWYGENDTTTTLAKFVDVQNGHSS